MRFHQRLMHLWRALGSRSGSVALVDGLALLLASYLALALRFTFRLPHESLGAFQALTFLFVPVVMGALVLSGQYRVYWLQASIEECYRLARFYFAGSVAAIVVVALAGIPVPRSSFAVAIFLGLSFIAGSRLLWRLIRLESGRCGERVRQAFIIGAGEAGSLLARDLLRSGSALRPVAFFDDDGRKQGKIIATLPVLGPIADLAREAERLGVDDVVIAMPSLPGTRIREILDLLRSRHFQVRVIPAMQDLAGGRVSVSALRKVNLEDLLRREPIRLDNGRIRSVVEGRTVLVTGAGGSIGSEICRQILAYGPKKLLLLGHGEHSIYTLLEELRDIGVTVPVVPLIADVADSASMGRIFAAWGPEVVFHAAAHKHVPLMECNAAEALRVNVFGTATVARLAGEFRVTRMVMISTDKAVNPTSVMGATKRLAEMVLEETQESFPETAYMAVRFGNVLGSRGSVIPKFERQIERGGPVTVTDPEMRRYFMLIPEAVSLVLQASALGRGGELFVLDMGEPVRIVELAEMLIRLHGREPYRDVEIAFSGIRPGEKLFEELFYDVAKVSRTAHDKIFLARLDIQKGNALRAQIAAVLREGIDDDGARRLLARFVLTFKGPQSPIPFPPREREEALPQAIEGGGS